LGRLDLFVSNRLDTVLGNFVDILKNDPQPPMREELILVQSKGMMRWVSLMMAEHLGIAANYRFIFPKKLVDNLFRSIHPELTDDSLFDRVSMTWAIMKILPELLDRTEFSSIRNYLKNGNDIRIYQLSAKIAGIFDQYMVYRPDMLSDWSESDSTNWQVQLWQHLENELKSWHFAGLRED